MFQRFARAALPTLVGKQLALLRGFPSHVGALAHVVPRPADHAIQLKATRVRRGTARFVAIVVPGAAGLCAHARGGVVARHARRARRAGFGHRVDGAALAVDETDVAGLARDASAARRGDFDEFAPW